MRIDDVIRKLRSQFPSLTFRLREENGVPNIFAIYQEGDREIAQLAQEFAHDLRDDPDNVIQHFVVDIYGGEEAEIDIALS